MPGARRDRIAGVLAAAVIVASGALLFGWRSSGGASDRSRDDQVLARAMTAPRSTRPRLPAANDAATRAVAEMGEEAPTRDDAAATRGADAPLKADVRPAPPPEAFQVRPAPARAFDTRLVFSDRPPPADPMKNSRPSTAAQPPIAPSPADRFVADIRPAPPPATSAHHQMRRARDTGLVFSSRPSLPPEGFDKYRR